MTSAYPVVSGRHQPWLCKPRRSPRYRGLLKQADKQKPAKRRQRLSELVVGVLLGVVTLLLRAEDSLHFWVVIEERKEDGDTFDDGGAEFRLDSFPIVVEPALDGFELGKFFGIGLGRVQDRASLAWNALHP